MKVTALKATILRFQDDDDEDEIFEIRHDDDEGHVKIVNYSTDGGIGDPMGDLVMRIEQADALYHALGEFLGYES